MAISLNPYIEKFHHTDVLSPAKEDLESRLEESIGHLLIGLQFDVEKLCDERVENILEKTKKSQAYVSDLTELLTAIEGELSNPQATTIHLGDHSVLVDRISEHLKHPLLKKDQLTRSEAEAITKALARDSEYSVRNLNQQFTQATQEIEKRHEYLSTFREILRILQGLQKCLVDNQKAR